jgi:energy-coupling factor transporter ATP-binding protein EcfA2
MTDWTPDPERITYIAATHTRGKNVAFGIRAKDRDKHIYIIGKSGMGKSTLLENMAIQDIQNGEGTFFIDPHGSTAERLLDFVPQDRIKDVMYFAPFDTENPIGFNVLEDVGYENRHKVVAGLMGVFERIWADAWSARMQYILQNTLFALLEYPGATIIDVNRMLVNKAFREEVLKHVTDPVVAMFWKEEFASYTDRYTQEATPAIQNKIGQFVSNPLIRNILGQGKSTFDFRKMMDERKIVIINLSKGRMGEANSALLGSMLVIKIYLAALSRADEHAHTIAKLPNCYFYVDEFQNVTNKAFENILSEARKYKLCLTIANQYIEQMQEEVRNAVFGNVGTTIIFRVGPIDAQFLEPVFSPTFMPEDMVGLGLGDIYLTLMIDGIGSAPFSARTLAPVDTPDKSYSDDIVYWTQSRYGRLRVEVEKEIKEFGEKWQQEAREKHKSDSARGQQKPQQKPMGSMSTRPRQSGGQAAGLPGQGGSRPDRLTGQGASRDTSQRPPRQEQRFEPRHRGEQQEYREHRERRTPTYSPPLPQREEKRAPADVLRSMPHQKQRPPHKPPMKPQHDARSALKDAIASAIPSDRTDAHMGQAGRPSGGVGQHGQYHQSTRDLPAARQFVQRSTPPNQDKSPTHHTGGEPPKNRPQNDTMPSHAGEVDSEELEGLLYGDDEHTKDQ